MDAAAFQIGAHTHPAERGILKPGFGAMSASVRPCNVSGRGVAIERGERLACGCGS
jgi:hypothetical protein